MASASLLLAACSTGTPDPAPTTAIQGVETFDDLSNEHTTEPVDYPQVPPVGGPHLPPPGWLVCDVYDEPVPAEAAVHSMEHGGIWITYQPGLPDDDVARLGALTEIDEEYVLVSPYEDLPSPVVASTWGLQLQVDDAADPRLREFVETYAGGDQGGEPGAPCRTGGVTPEEARAAIEG